MLKCVRRHSSPPNAPLERTNHSSPPSRRRSAPNCPCCPLAPESHSDRPEHWHLPSGRRTSSCAQERLRPWQNGGCMRLRFLSPTPPWSAENRHRIPSSVQRRHLPTLALALRDPPVTRPCYQ